ncbi:MAG: LTA synthase family protein [Bdellovibrionales bacterium]
MSFRIFWRLGFVLLLFYTLQRGLFWFWNRDYYTDSAWQDILLAFIYGIRFDLVAISWILLLTLLWAWVVRRWTWWVPALLSLGFYILSIVDNELNKFWARRLTFSLVKLFREADGKVAGLAGDYLFWFLLGLALSVPFLFQIHRLFRFEVRHISRGLVFWLKQLGFVLILILLSRGGLQKKPVSMIHSQIFDQPELNLLVLNTSFSLMKSLSKNSGVQRVRLMPEEEALIRSNRYQKAETVQSPIKNTERPNLVVIILESFSSEYTRLNPQLKLEYTPFFNSLMLRGFVFPNTFANGRRSIEGVAAILAGIPVLMEEPFISSEYSALKISGIGESFNERGYDTSFYHGGDNGTMTLIPS